MYKSASTVQSVHRDGCNVIATVTVQKSGVNWLTCIFESYFDL